MPITRWTASDWDNIQKLGNALASATFEMNERIGAGGYAVSASELTAAAQRAESLLARIKEIANNYY